jgi:hypothetical protein
MSEPPPQEQPDSRKTEKQLAEIRNIKYLAVGVTHMKRKPKLPLAAVKALLEQGLYLKDVSSHSGFTEQELCVMNKIWGLKRKRGPKVGWKNEPV